eukprot:scaffold46155_cov60-Phaeocystis_antarctica.AAC.3
MPRAAPSSSQPRPIRRLVRRWPTRAGLLSTRRCAHAPVAHHASRRTRSERAGRSARRSPRPGQASPSYPRVLGSSPAWHTSDISQLVPELAGLQLHDGRVAAAAVQAEDVLRRRGRADGSRAKQASDTHGESQAVGRHKT